MSRARQTTAVSIALAVIVGSALAQPAESVPYDLRSGAYDNSTADFVVIPVYTVVVPDAPWLQVHVGDFNLGRHSCVVFTSVEDGYSLRHDARTLAQWRGWSAFFNGDAVDIELHVAPGDTGVFVAVDEILVGLRGGPTNAGAPPRAAVRATPTRAPRLPRSGSVVA